jgi:hypothetical protein
LPTAVIHFTNVLKAAEQQGWEVALIAEVAGARPLKQNVQQVAHPFLLLVVVRPPAFSTGWIGMAGLNCFSAFFCHFNCCEANFILRPLRIMLCYANVIHARHSKAPLESIRCKETIGSASLGKIKIQART